MTLRLYDRFPLPEFWPAFVTGRFYTSQIATGTTGTLTLAADTLYAIPFANLTDTSVTMVTIGIEQTTSTTGNYRLGVYYDISGEPGTILFDAGSVAMGGSAGFKSIAISQTVAPGWYWLALNASVTPTVRAYNQTSCLDWLGSTSGTDTTKHPGLQVASTFGTLPDPFPGGYTLMTTNAPRVLIGP